MSSLTKTNVLAAAVLFDPVKIDVSLADRSAEVPERAKCELLRAHRAPMWGKGRCPGPNITFAFTATQHLVDALLFAGEIRFGVLDALLEHLRGCFHIGTRQSQ